MRFSVMLYVGKLSVAIHLKDFNWYMEVEEVFLVLRNFHIKVSKGVGAGLFNVLLQFIRFEYLEKIITSYTVLPSPRIDSMATHPVNTIYCMNEIIENTDLSFFFNNDKMYDIGTSFSQTSKPQFDLYNKIIVNSISDITAPWRWEIFENFHKLEHLLKQK